jgi:indolepyruvate ferredoxin oxidoreductase
VQAIDLRRKFLVEYQNDNYAQRYTSLVERVRSAEKAAFPSRTDMTKAVARYYYKLLAIKDEYEVARLHVNSGFLQGIERQFEGNYKLVFNLAPPLLARRNPSTGELEKREFGAWIIPVFKVLASLRALRGTAFDVFGYTQERRIERSLISEYETNVEKVIEQLRVSKDVSTHETAVELLSLPEQIRGYGHVRERTIEDAKVREVDLLAALQRKVIPLKKAA